MPQRIDGSLYRIEGAIPLERNSPSGFTPLGGELPLTTPVTNVTVTGISLSATASLSVGRVDITKTIDGVAYLLRDRFTSAVNPLVDAAASDIGTRDVTGTYFYTENGRLCGGVAPSAWGQSALFYGGLERVGGRTLVAMVTPQDGEAPLSFGWFPNTTPGTPDTSGYTFILEGKNITVSEPGKQITSFNVNGRPNRPTQYLLGVTLNETQGAVYWISSLDTQTNDSDWDIPVYPNARTVWVSTVGTDTMLYPSVQTTGGFTPEYDGGHSIEDIRVFDVSGWAGADGMALVADRFNREDSSTTLGGSWTADSGTWGISSNKAYTTTGGRAVINAGVADYFVTCTFDVATVTSDSFGLMMRRVSSTDYTWISNEDTANIYWKSWLSGFDDFIYSTYGAFTDSSVVRIVAAVKGNEWRFWQIGGNDTVMEVTVAPPSGVDHTTGTYVGLFGDTNTRWDNFAAYPIEFALPSSFNTGAYPTLTAGGSTLVSDTFTDTNGTNLTAHDTDVGSGSWAVTNGTWDIQSNKANSTPVASPEHNFAYVDAGQANVEVSVDITMPSSGDEGSGGIVIRRSDANNFIYARTLWQSGSNEIEIWKVVGGTTEMAKKCYMGSTYSLGSTYNMKLTAEDDLLHISLDGEVYATIILPSALLTGTGVGLYEWYSSDGVTFDNFTVKGVASTNVTVDGASLSASVSTSFGSVIAVQNVSITGASLSASVSSSFGAVSGSAVSAGAALSATASASYGTVSGTATVTGASLSATVSTSFGSVTAVQNVTITGVSLLATVSGSYGSVTGSAVSSGASLSTSVSSSFGAVSGSAVTSGASLSASVSAAYGTVTGSAVVSGASLTATASLAVGSVDTGSSGNVTVDGVSLSATASLAVGSVSAGSSVSGASLTATVSSAFGSVTTTSNASITGAALTATVSSSFGSVVAVRNVVVSGASLSASTSISVGSIGTGVGVTGALLNASVSAAYGSVSTVQNVVTDGVSLSAAASLVVGTAFGTGAKIAKVSVEGTYLYGVRGVAIRNEVGVTTGVKTKVTGRVVND